MNIEVPKKSPDGELVLSATFKWYRDRPCYWTVECEPLGRQASAANYIVEWSGGAWVWKRFFY